MGYKVVLTEAAQEDLDGILGYIAHSLANPMAALAFADAVERCYSNLEQMPRMYETCQDSRLSSLGYRKAVIKNYFWCIKFRNAQKRSMSCAFSMVGRIMPNDFDRRPLCSIAFPLLKVGQFQKELADLSFS